MVVTVHRMDVKIPSQVPWVVAVPGVGNVGKLVIDGLLEEHESRLAVALVHPDCPLMQCLMYLAISKHLHSVPTFSI